MSDLDFYKLFQQQSNEAYGDLRSDYATVPIPPTSLTLEELTKSDSDTSNIATTTALTSTATSVTPTETQSFSYPFHASGYVPKGDVPKGYRSAECCGTCEYWCNPDSICYKHDFPCHALYICDSYESLDMESEEEREIGEVFSEGSLFFDIPSLTEEELEILAEGWTDKGTVKSETRKRKAVLSEGRFPIFDKRSAQSALKLRGKANNLKERKMIIRAASRYAPEEAKEALEKDQQNLSLVYAERREPSKPTLFALAYSSADATEGDLESVYGIYSELYETMYGTKEGMYVVTEVKEEHTESKAETTDAIKTATTIEQVATKEALSEFEASVSVASSAGVVESVIKDPLYQVASNRMLLSAKKAGVPLDETAVLEEYNRLVKLRNA
jgi:hypothetical protein